MPTPVFEALQEVLKDENEVGGYEAERRAKDDIAAFYAEFASLLNCAPDEIAYVENATRAWDMAFYGLNLKKGDRVITHGSEYASNYLALLQQSRRLGFEIAGRVGLMAAVKYARGVGLNYIEARVQSLAQDLRTDLEALEGVEVHDLGETKCGIVTFTKAGTDAAEMADKLRQSGINVSVSAMS